MSYLGKSYWDPANLLQITLDADDSYGSIQCTGESASRANKRCRWDIEDPDRSKVRPLLSQISRLRPEAVPNSTLRELARLCLCPQYHATQDALVVARWTRILKTASEHHRNLLASFGDGQSVSGELSKGRDAQWPASGTKRPVGSPRKSPVVITKEITEMQERIELQAKTIRAWEAGSTVQQSNQKQETSRLNAEIQKLNVSQISEVNTDSV